MTRDRNLLANSPQATSAARLPALSKPKPGDWAGLSRWMDAVAEHLQVRQGARRSTLETAVTKRDLMEATGVTQIVTGGPMTGNVMMQLAGGGWASISVDAFAQLIRNTRLYKDLMKRIDDPMRFDRLSKEIRDLLLPDLNELARQRGADIRHLETKIQDATQSFAASIEEVTAGFGAATAGIRQSLITQATQTYATAVYAVQITARLDDLGGAGIEEVYAVTADRLNGLEAQWTLKASAGGAFAAIGLSATSSTAGEEDSAIILVADRLAFVTPGAVAGVDFDPQNPDSSLIPLGVDASGVYINGFVRINAGGPSLADLTKAVRLSVPTQAFKQDKNGNWDRATITITANVTGGLAGTPAWSVVSGVYTGALAAGATLAVDRTLMGTDNVTFRATVTDGSTTYSDDMTLVKLVDGANAVTAFLTNEACTVPATSAGVVSSFAGAAGSFKVFNGTTDVTGTAVFSIQSNPDGLTGSISAAGAYSFTAAGTWSNASRTSNITLRAAYNGVNYDKVFTITKSNAGTAGLNGNDGARGSLTGYGSQYGIYFTGSSWADGVGTTNANKANAVIWNMLNGTSLTTQSLTTHLRIGDTVTLTNGASPTASYTKFWSGTQWLTPGVVIDGNLLVLGTVSALMFDGVGIRIGTGRSPNGKAFEVNSAGAVWADNLVVNRGVSINNQIGDPSGPMTVQTNTNDVAILASVGAAQSGLNAHAIRGRNNSFGTSGLVGPANSSFDFYAELKGAYGPFTGAHDGLLAKGEDLGLVEGDIVVDVECLGRSNISNTIFKIAGSTQACQRGVVGVIAGPRHDLDEGSPPNALIVDSIAVTDDEGKVVGIRHVLVDEFDALAATYDRVTFNAVGEGQINVCGRGGNIAQGDYICASSMPGKGMRQAPLTIGDQQVHMQVDYTVAKARESVTFDSPDQVKTIAVTYHCG